MKGNKGVTLVALVITIIVLLILAGVSISLVVGDNGVLSQAMNAADQTGLSTVEEQINLAVGSAVADWVDEKYISGGTTTLDEYLLEYDLASNMNSGIQIVSKDDAFVPSEGEGVPEGQMEANIVLSYNGQNYTCKIVMPEGKNTASVTSVALAAD